MSFNNQKSVRITNMIWSILANVALVAGFVLSLLGLLKDSENVGALVVFIVITILLVASLAYTIYAIVDYFKRKRFSKIQTTVKKD